MNFNTKSIFLGLPLRYSGAAGISVEVSQAVSGSLVESFLRVHLFRCEYSKHRDGNADMEHSPVGATWVATNADGARSAKAMTSFRHYSASAVGWAWFRWLSQSWFALSAWFGAIYLEFLIRLNAYPYWLNNSCLNLGPRSSAEMCNFPEVFKATLQIPKNST